MAKYFFLYFHIFYIFRYNESLPIKSYQFFKIYKRFDKKEKKKSTHTAVIENRRKSVLTYRKAEFLFSVWVFFHEYHDSRTAGKVEVISLFAFYHFHPFHRHLDISQVIATENSPLRIVNSWTRTENLRFPSASR